MNPLSLLLILAAVATYPLAANGSSYSGAAIPQDIREGVSLIPDKPSDSPDYFCTWNIQGYVSSYASSDAERRAMNEGNLFGRRRYQDWVELYPKIRSDLYLVMDDSWDVPLDGNKAYFGSLMVDSGRFPSFQGTPLQRMTKLVSAVKARGWKGLGGWVCAQESPIYPKISDSEYWKERLHWARDSGFAYWKVDWGKRSEDAQWRTWLSALGRTEAPNLTIEHAIAVAALPFSDVFRSYDVEVVTSAPETINRVAILLNHTAQSGARGLVNCEDEPYIGAALGCALGIMRHPFAGPLPSGRQDFPFPPVGRNLTRRIDEVNRAVRWHRIAPPFAVGSNVLRVDADRLLDHWVFGVDETWTSRKPGDRAEVSAPARVTRGMSLPDVHVAAGEPAPFVLACRHPNGAIAIATIGRTLGRIYINPRAEVVLEAGDLSRPIGVFGVFASLTLKGDNRLSGRQVWAQDLNGETPVNITREVRIDGRRIVIPGEVIDRIGLQEATPGDLSEPGMVIVIR